MKRHRRAAHRGAVLEFRISHYPADHPAAGRLATVVNADGKEQHLAYTTRGEQRAVCGDSVQPLLYDYNEYGERYLYLSPIYQSAGNENYNYARENVRGVGERLLNIVKDG